MSRMPKAVDFVGIVLKRLLVEEKGQIYSVYSRESGRIKASARGALKPKNRWRGVLEPFNRIRAVIHPSRTGRLHRLNEADFPTRPSWILKDLTALHAAYVVLECYERFTPEEYPHQEIYSLLLKSLGAVDRVPDLAGFSVRIFCIEFFTMNGFALEWNRCVRCGKERPADKSAFFVASEGELSVVDASGVTSRTRIESSMVQPFKWASWHPMELFLS